MLAILALAGSGEVRAAQCGSALLLETAAPAAIGGLSLATPRLARFWEAGAAAANRSDAGCAAGCTNATAAVCSGGGDCLALTGINWLNATCATAGHLPTRTVFLVEQTTSSSGGRWAAINLDRNAADANTDVDAKALSVCAGCASIASPYLGGTGVPLVTGSSLSGNVVVSANLTWSAPPAVAQALSNASSLIKSYAIYYRSHAGPPPPATGDPAGWTLVPDLQADGAANGGFSTDTTATVDVSVPGGSPSITFAVGLSFDGTGNPTADANTRASSYLSGQSAAVPASFLLFANGFEAGNTAGWSSTVQ